MDGKPVGAAEVQEGGVWTACVLVLVVFLESVVAHGSSAASAVLLFTMVGVRCVRILVQVVGVELIVVEIIICVMSV